MRHNASFTILYIKNSIYAARVFHRSNVITTSMLFNPSVENIVTSLGFTKLLILNFSIIYFTIGIY